MNCMVGMSWSEGIVFRIWMFLKACSAVFVGGGTGALCAMASEVKREAAAASETSWNAELAEPKKRRHAVPKPLDTRLALRMSWLRPWLRRQAAASNSRCGFIISHRFSDVGRA